MYIARFETDAGEWVQGAAGVEGVPPRSRSADEHPWWREIAGRLASAARIPKATVARRVCVGPDRPLCQVLAVLAPAEREQNVRDVFAGLTRLEQLVGGDLSLSQSREEHDQWLASPPPLRLWSLTEIHVAGGAQLACDFRVASVLDELLIDACLHGYRLWYQLHVRDAEVDPEWVRAARKNVLALDALTGASDGFLEWQKQIATALGGAAAFAEEFLMVDTPAAAEAVESVLQEAFRARYRGYGVGGAPNFHFQRDSYEEPLVVAAHSHDMEPLAPLVLAGAAIGAAERDQLLGWQPSERLAGLLAAGAAEVAPEPGDAEPPDSGTLLLDPETLGIPRPHQGGGEFAFVSYKRQDIRRIAPLLRELSASGLEIWYDRGIPGGAEWDAVIEERIRSCTFVLLFASHAAVGSKYVRREVKFADAQDTPILTVLLEDTPLGQGLEMLLSQYQMLDSRAADFPHRLRTAVNHLGGAGIAAR